MKKIFSYFLVFLLACLLAGCNFFSPGNESFAALEDELFLVFLGQDPVNINFTLYYPEEYNLEDVEVTAYEFSKEGEDNYFKALKEIKREIEKFSDRKLNNQNKLTKKIVLDYIDHKLAYEGYYYFGTNLGSYLGYQSQLPLILAEYRFDRIKDIENYLAYLEITQTNFEGIINFEEDKAEKGYGLTNVILERSIEQCLSFVNSDECYLIPVFEDKIESLDYLNDQQKELYKSRHKQIINNQFLPAYTYLAEEMNQLKNNAKTKGNLASFENGDNYYQILFQDAIGTNETIDDVKVYIQNKLFDSLNTYFNLLNDYEVSYVYETNSLMKDLTLPELIPFFMEKVKGSFPELKKTPDYSVTNIADELVEHSSPAMYFLTPIDDSRKESIYINPLQVEEGTNYTYQVIAHEGYPGHLLQHVYLKETSLSNLRKLLNFGGYAEGWATYVENYVISFIYENEKYRKMFEVGNSLNYLILGYADIHVNYYNWSVNQLQSFLSNYFLLSNEEIDDLYYDLTEVPTNYLKYYYSYYRIQDMKENFKEKMGDSYSDLLFHTIFLDTGPCSLDILEEVYRNY